MKVDGNAHANTIQSSTIGGDAYYQSITGSTVTGTSYPGSPDPPVEAMPVSSSNIVDWEASAASSGNLSTGLCNSSSANITLDAGVLDCTASGAFAPSSSSLTITLNGIVWIKGNITLPNNSLVVLSSGYGGKSGILIADAPDPMTGGKIDTGNGSVICGSQGYIPGNPPVCNATHGSYIMF